MKIGIIAAMPEELAYLVQHLDNAQEQVVLGNTYHTGTIASHEVVLVESGIGKVMSAMSVAILADHFQVDALINTGSAGAVAEGIAVGDVVIADKLAYHDVDVTAFRLCLMDKWRNNRFISNQDKTFVAKIQESLSQLDQNWHLGLIATGDSFVAGNDKIEAIKSHFPEVLAVEMEGTAIAQAAHALNLPVLVIRAMSDNANHEANISFDEFIIEAGRRSAQVLLAFLKALN
ncbi:5'-methylthioadenosine nucleosidase / S-adenosylhomocysteine nucleosidase [Streptococcus mitis]|uniref:adenosylhomocysteine nucleosidase n=1 Tax=Streptococcus mitis TaxID=28037 RepID=A0A150NWD4_STRMT|nr:5'-methylthioadenosine nucleosidase / S-adenosylhomocysteine nucleosidase [Streptococcus mitis]